MPLHMAVLARNEAPRTEKAFQCRVRAYEHAIQQARSIGWPALEASMRRSLQSLKKQRKQGSSAPRTVP